VWLQKNDSAIMMLQGFLIGLIALHILSSTLANSPVQSSYSCQVTLPSGQYDFSGLANTNGDYELTTNDGTFFINLCRATVINCTEMSVSSINDTFSSGCRMFNNMSYSIGLTDTVMFEGNATEVFVHFTGGMSGSQMGIHLICSTEGRDRLSFLGEITPGYFQFSWLSSNACAFDGTVPNLNAFNGLMSALFVIGLIALVIATIIFIVFTYRKKHVTSILE